MTETAIRKSADFRLENDRFQLAEHARNHWVVTVEQGVTAKEMLEPAYWANVAAKLRPWDIIEARRDDGAYWAEFVVLGAERTFAKVALLREVKLTTKDVAETQRDGLPAGYVYQWKGANMKHCIVRTSDGAIIHEKAHTKADALHWATERKAELTAERVAGTTRLKIYNAALRLCGERFLASLTEEREPRRLLDNVWDGDGVRYCLEQGDWQFARRTQKIDYDPSTEPPFGFIRAFNKPTDWVATHEVCSDPYFRNPMSDRQYRDEVDFWFADLDTIYVSIVSDLDTYGRDLSRWPQSFCDYVNAYFASEIILKLSSDKQKLQFLLGAPGKMDGGELGRRLKVAKNRAAMTRGTRIPAESSWNRARHGRNRGPMGDGGTSGSLIG